MSRIIIEILAWIEIIVFTYMVVTLEIKQRKNKKGGDEK